LRFLKELFSKSSLSRAPQSAKIPLRFKMAAPRRHFGSSENLPSGRFSLLPLRVVRRRRNPLQPRSVIFAKSFVICSSFSKNSGLSTRQPDFYSVISVLTSSDVTSPVPAGFSSSNPISSAMICEYSSPSGR